jgi:cystathionine beta-synthase
VASKLLRFGEDARRSLEAGVDKLADAVAQHMLPPLPMIGAGELVNHAAKALRDCDAVMVVEEGKPVGVLTRHDLLGFLSEGNTRR